MPLARYAPFVAALALIGCAELPEGDIITGPGGLDQQTFTLEATALGSMPGDSVFIGGSFVTSWTPENPNAMEHFGFVAADESITGSYSRPVWAAGETYSVILWRKTNGYLYPVLTGLTANGVPITATIYSAFAIFREFGVNRDSNGNVVVDPLRDDSDRFVESALWTDGIYSDHPDSLFLNEPIGPEEVVLCLSADSGFRLLPGTYYPGGDSYVRQGLFVRPGVYYLRWEKASGKAVFAGCNVGAITCSHLVDLPRDLNPNTPPGTPSYWVFKIRVLENGTFQNFGPPNLLPILTVGHGG